jgi:hypothetical protein
MPANDRGSLRAAFTNFNRPEAEKEAELKLLGRTVDTPAEQPVPKPEAPPSYQIATSPAPSIASAPATGGLTPRPLLQREAVRQLSFRCPVLLASELRKKAAFNQLEQQQIIVEGIKRVLAELPDPPEGWQD